MILCLYCKEAHPSEHCPLYLKAQALFKQKQWKLSSSFSSQAPAPFIGHHGYPKVSVGVLSPPGEVDDADQYDAPRSWAVGNYQIPQIVDYRSSLVNSRQLLSVKEKNNRTLSFIQEVGMAKKAVDIDVKLTNAPRFTVRADGYCAPTGPRGVLSQLSLTSNPRVNVHVEKAVSDTDFKSTDALVHLYNKGITDHELMKLLSVGNLGVGSRRKLVPTRWSITATDDTLSRHLHQQIIHHPVADCTAYFGGYLGNYFLLLFFDRPWSYELFEMSLRGNGPLQWTTDFETNFGRKHYAEETAGGYYACKTPILEKLAGIRRQASVLALRFITSEYTLPLGVWVVREAVRKALSSKPLTFSDSAQLLAYAKSFSSTRFDVDCTRLFSESRLLKSFSQQSLSDYFQKS